MFENDFMVEFNDEELGECRTYPRNFKGYEQAIKDLKLYKAKQNQRISELEEQLKNAIVPKFKFMEKVWHINKDYFYKKDWYVEELLINGFEYKIDKRKNALVMWYSTYFNDYKNYKYQEKELFATKEEALAKLKELQGENK